MSKDKEVVRLSHQCDHTAGGRFNISCDECAKRNYEPSLERCTHGVSLWQWCEQCRGSLTWNRCDEDGHQFGSLPDPPRKYDVFCQCGATMILKNDELITDRRDVLMGVSDIFDCSEMD